MADSLTTLPSRSPIAVMPVWTRTLANELAAQCAGSRWLLEPESPWQLRLEQAVLCAIPAIGQAGMSGLLSWGGPAQPLTSDPVQVASVPAGCAPQSRQLGWTVLLRDAASAVVRWDVIPAADQPAAVTIQAVGPAYPVPQLLMAELLLDPISWELT